MENREVTPENTRIQKLLDLYLAAGNLSATSTANSSGDHLDEDSLSAFVEGDLQTRDEETAVRHLVDCGFCRHASADLMRLQLALSHEAPASIASEAKPLSKVSEFLAGILEKISGSAEAAVFAHDEKQDAEDESAGKEKDE
jgi:hypothetical protein